MAEGSLDRFQGRVPLARPGRSLDLVPQDAARDRTRYLTSRDYLNLNQTGGVMTLDIEEPQTRTYTEADTEDFEHVGPGTLMGRWLRRFWHPVFIAADLKPNWPRQVRLMGEDF